MIESLRQYIEARVMPVTESGCWIWIGYLSSRGYGFVYHTPKPELLAHRASWHVHNGPVPDGMRVCHRCDIRCCVNPDHLFLGTDADNMRDRDIKDRVAHGVRSAQHRLKPADVYLIRASADRSSDLARQFGVTPQAIGAVRSRRSWRRLPERT